MLSNYLCIWFHSSEAYVNREYTIFAVILSLVDIEDRTRLSSCYISTLTPKSFVRTHNCRWVRT